jgi:uncharacterized protein DUF2442
MMKVTALKPLPDYHLWLRFFDGTEGTVDLSSYVGDGVFQAWKDQNAFARVRVGDFGQPLWDGDIDLCADALYRTLTGHLPSGFSLKGEPAHA